jgi:hypothetical protein
VSGQGLDGPHAWGHHPPPDPVQPATCTPEQLGAMCPHRAISLARGTWVSQTPVCKWSPRPGHVTATGRPSLNVQKPSYRPVGPVLPAPECGSLLLLSLPGSWDHGCRLWVY